MRTQVESRPVVGLTGARFGNVRRREADEGWPPAAEQPAAPEPVAAPGDHPIGQTGARFGGARRRRRVRTEAVAPVPARIPAPRAASPEVPSQQIPLQRSTASVRPYVLTRGRTRSSVVLSLETLVSAAPTPAPGVRPPRTHEHRAAVALCREPRSVAEVAALLGVPLGVAGVLLGDLATAGLVVVHGTASASHPDLALLERVRRGLHGL